MRLGKKAARGVLCNLEYMSPSVASVSFMSVPCFVRRKLSTWPDCTACASSESDTSIRSQLVATRRSSHCERTHGDCSTAFRSHRAVGTFCIMPWSSSSSSASSHASLHVHSVGSVTRAMRSCWLVAGYGRQPKTMACNVTPRLHTSATFPA